MHAGIDIEDVMLTWLIMIWVISTSFHEIRNLKNLKEYFYMDKASCESQKDFSMILG